MNDKWQQDLEEIVKRERRWALRCSIVSLIGSVVSLIISIAAYWYWLGMNR